METQGVPKHCIRVLPHDVFFFYSLAAFCSNMSRTTLMKRRAVVPPKRAPNNGKMQNVRANLMIFPAAWAEARICKVHQLVPVGDADKSDFKIITDFVAEPFPKVASRQAYK